MFIVGIDIAKRAHIDRVKVVYYDLNGLTVASSDLRASDDKRNEQSIYAVHSALGFTVSVILLEGCQPVIVEGTSDQCYLNAVKLHLLQNKKFSHKNELVFLPSGGVKGVPGITSIISGRNGKLPHVILDSDKSGQDARNKLISSLYIGEEMKLLEIETFTELERSEVEDIIPFTIMERQIDRLFREVEDAEFADEYVNTSPILPQIE